MVGHRSQSDQNYALLPRAYRPRTRDDFMRALSSKESTGTRYIHSGSQIWWYGVSYSHGGLPSKRIGSLPSGVPRSKAPVWHEAMTQDPCVGSRDLLGSLLRHAIHRIGECRRSEKQPMRACSHVLLQRCRCAQCPPLSLHLAEMLLRVMPPCPVESQCWSESGHPRAAGVG